MKTTIHITGQISGNHRLANKIIVKGKDIESVNNAMFYGKKIVFKTKKSAQKALWEAYKSLVSEEPEIKNKLGGIRYSPGSTLFYDASQAQILN